MSEKIDSVDIYILNTLLKDAQKPLSSIAKTLNISPAAVKHRVDKLKKNNIIVGSGISINKKKLGLNTEAYIAIFLEKASMNKRVIETLEKVDEITECHYSTGAFSLFVRLLCENNAHMTSVLTEKIQSIEGVVRTETFILLESPIGRNIDLSVLKNKFGTPLDVQ